MHPIPNLIVIYVFIVMGIGFTITILRLIIREGSLWGKPSVNPFQFYSEKLQCLSAGDFH